MRTIICCMGPALAALAQPLTMTVDARKTGAPITPFLYGQFTENANNNFYRTGIWSELVDDRKFYAPVTTAAPEVQAPGRGGGGRGGGRRWIPVGGDSVLVMDVQQAWSGKHSPKIALDATSPHGIQQTGLAVQKGRKYTGRVVLAGDAGAQVQVILIWGANPADRQSVKVTGISREYRKFALAFTAGADSNEATIEIVGTGKGSFQIGAVSIMPADNVHGWRADSIRALKEIGIPMVRYGGNFVSGYEWRDGVGDPDKRPSRWDYAWRMMEPNDVGTDEILALTAALGAEPYISVNAGFGDAYSAEQWVEYCNGAATTPMGKLRAANGHPEPYKVKWWNIGNENYGPWQMGQMQIRHYAIKHNMFAEAMKRADSSIKIVAVGATPAEMSTTGSGKSYGMPVVEFGSAADWNFVMLSDAAANFDNLAEHLYPKGNQAYDLPKQQFVAVEEPWADHARRLPNRVKSAVEAWEEYQKRFPKLNMKSIQIALDEWTPGNMGVRAPLLSVISSAEALHELFRNSEWFSMAAFTHLSGLVSGRTETTILPIGRMFQLYRNHFGTIPVEINGNSPQHEVKGVVNVDKPKVSSGSDTYPLDAAAALSADRRTLTLAVVNPTEADQEISVNFEGVSLQGSGKLLRIVAPETPAQTPPQPGAGGQGLRGPAVNIAETRLTEIPGKLAVPKQSISIYELPVR
ncbi:MAG: alpha-N-arabinofuranosidase [Candidatus Solibacter sp.]